MTDFWTEQLALPGKHKGLQVDARFPALTLLIQRLSIRHRKERNEIMNDSETSKHRHLVLEYCKGNGVDLGSSGDPVVPWAIQVELPQEQYRIYNVTRPVNESIQWRGSALDLPFKDQTLDFVHSSHLLEDFREWAPVLREWDRVLKPGGYMLIAVPDHQRFRAAVARGQGDNLSHRHESYPGELTKMLHTYAVLRDTFVTDHPHEYSILYIGRKAE